MRHETSSSSTNLFFTLIRIAVGRAERFPVIPTPNDWNLMYAEAQRQALLGVLFKGVERIPEEQRPPRELVLKWYSVKEQIQKRNILMNCNVKTLMERMEKDGMRPCLLKGQGVATLYDEPLCRVPGDIDVWADVPKKHTIDYVRERCGNKTVCPHHIDFPIFNDVMVELHFRPAIMMNPLTNIRLRDFFNHHRKDVFDYNVPLSIGNFQTHIIAPTPVFNAVFLLVHSFKHFLGDGIGMRQMMDYYYLLNRGLTAEEKDEAKAMFRRLHVTRFAGALMYVMHEVFGLEQSKMIVPADTREGLVLLKSIMAGGNFGRYSSSGWKKPKSGHLVRYLYSLPHMLRLLRHYPSEVIFAPIYSIYFFFHLRAYR